MCAAFLHVRAIQCAAQSVENCVLVARRARRFVRGADFGEKIRIFGGLFYAAFLCTCARLSARLSAQLRVLTLYAFCAACAQCVACTQCAQRADFDENIRIFGLFFFARLSAQRSARLRVLTIVYFLRALRAVCRLWGKNQDFWRTF